MKKRILIIISSILIASLFLPGGYGSWTNKLIIQGSIEVVQSTPTRTPIPAQKGNTPVLNEDFSKIPESNQAADEHGLSNGLVSDAISQDNNDKIEEETENETGQQEQAGTGETNEDNVVSEDVQGDSGDGGSASAD